MPDLIKLYIRNVALGFVISAIFVAGLLYFNILNLWGLVTHSDVGLMAVGMLWFMNGIVFAGVQFGYAIMQMARKEDDTPRGPGVRDYIPVPVPAQDDRRKARLTKTL